MLGGRQHVGDELGQRRAARVLGRGEGAVRRSWTSTSPISRSIASSTGSSPPAGSASASNSWATTSGKPAGCARMLRAART
ncbi:hypothetical protein [Nocardioides exalbidus]|uniref:hypothetical protein n=1 Tax=Nocardioides exalbidus TaxID=402596 RepID=UPI001FE006E9|nr:hypothetical protein [Nocardioides exalbidus]